ncbi:MAG: CotH kinase family protein [Acidimicrobiales bacterium]|nr:CotH kinase family protein [Acidimicrobiales bacterium]
MNTRRCLALLLAFALSAVACSSGDDGDPAASDPTDTPSTTHPFEGDEPPADEPETSEDSRNVGVESGVPDGSFLFDDGELHTFEINLSEENLALIDADPSAEEYVEGEVTFGGETRTVGIRYKGSIGAWVNCLEGTRISDGFQGIFNPSGAKACTKLSIKVKINWQNSNDEWHGQRKFQFHSMNLDPTQMHDRLGYWLFREMGVPAPRATHARIVLNGAFLGLFSLVEQIDGRFTRHNFDDGTGNLYKEVWPLDGSGRPVPVGAYEAGLKTNENENPSFALVEEFAAAITAPGADTAAVVAEWMDVEESLAYFAVERTIRHDDGLSHWRCFGPCVTHNFFLYEDPTNERFHVIAWDLDNAFQVLRTSGFNGILEVADDFGEISGDCAPFDYLGSPQRSAACDPIIGALASYTDEYRAVLDEFLAGPFSVERTDEVLDRWSAQIADATAEAAATHDDAVPVAVWEASVAALREDLETARANAAG